MPETVKTWGSGRTTLGLSRAPAHWALTLLEHGTGGDFIVRWDCRVAYEDASADVAEEIGRHLWRQATQGHLPNPPATQVQTVMWDAAVGLALAFIERYGTLKEWREELSR